MKRKEVLVTGGFGFIGSHLVDLLLQGPDNYVHVVDSLVTSTIDLPAYLSHMAANGRLTYDITTVGEYFARAGLPKWDNIYHLASIVGPVGVLDHCGRIVQSMVADTYAIAEYALTNGARICDVSTSEVYGGGRDGYCSEADAKIIPPRVTIRLEYAVGKLACEVALINLQRRHGLQVVIVRPFNVAGPRQSPRGGFVLPRFIHQALAGEPITVYGDGSMIRAFTHVRDVVSGIVRVMERGCPGEAYNIGNPGNKTTIATLARKVVEITRSSSKIVHVDPKKLWGPFFEEANDKFPDADRAINDLGWRPKYDLDATIRDTVSYIAEEGRD